MRSGISDGLVEGAGEQFGCLDTSGRDGRDRWRA